MRWTERTGRGAPPRVRAPTEGATLRRNLVAVGCVAIAACAQSRLPDAAAVVGVEASMASSADALSLEDVRVLLSAATVVSRSDGLAGEDDSREGRSALVHFEDGSSALLRVAPGGFGRLDPADGPVIFFRAHCLPGTRRIEEGTVGGLGDGYEAGVLVIVPGASTSAHPELLLAVWADSSTEEEHRLQEGDAFRAGRCHYAVTELALIERANASYAVLQPIPFPDGEAESSTEGKAEPGERRRPQ